MVTGTWQALAETLGVLLAGLLLVTLVWLGSHELIEGRLSVGQLVSFVGYAVFMVWPMQTFFEFAQKWVRGLVSARKTIALLDTDPPLAEGSAELGASPRLHDLASGLIVEPGRYLAVVSADPEDSAALADRLGRYLPGAAPVTDGDEELTGRAARRARREARGAPGCRRGGGRRDSARAPGASRPTASTTHSCPWRPCGSESWSPTPAASCSPAPCRPPSTRGQPHPRAGRGRAPDAAAEDVYAGLPGGWQGRIDELGRGLSGGQRQRVVLARALLLDPEVLVLVEPTSAVDAHTEARIAERLAEYRRGRTTVAITASPLLLHYADEVALLEDGKRGRPRHPRRPARHRTRATAQVVARGMEEDE